MAVAFSAYAAVPFTRSEGTPPTLPRSPFSVGASNATFVRSRTPPPANSGWSFFRRGSVPQEVEQIEVARPSAPDVREVMRILHFKALFKERRVRTVDFASVDVEGAEEAVLRTVNFRTVAVRVLVVERPTVAVRALLRDAGMAAVGEYSSALGDIMFAGNDLLAALSADERARRLALVRRLATPFDAARARLLEASHTLGLYRHTRARS